VVEMPTLKFTIKGVEFQYEAEEEQILRFINRFRAGDVTMPIQTKPILRSQVEASQEETTQKVVDLDLPTDDEVIKYITSKPKFSHDLFEVQRAFFNQTFKSRGVERRMYHRTARQLRLVRQFIEEKFNGKFMEEKSDTPGMKRFVFQPSSTIETYTRD
jgi:hypothetical protein